MDQKTKNIFVILGAPRTGTSVIARSLQSLGINLGNKLIPVSQQSKWNPKGFWEDKEIGVINAKIFATLGMTRYNIKAIREEDLLSERLSELKKEAMIILQDRFARTENWAFKDPLTIKTLHFWQDIFQQLNLQENYIIALRNPLASAKSYQQLTNVDCEKGLLLWIMHLILAVHYTQNKNRLVVNYEFILQNPLHELERLHQNLKVSLPVNSENWNIFASEFLDAKLDQHVFSLSDLQNHPAVSVAPLCKEVYQLLLLISQDKLKFTDNYFILEWQKIMARFAEIYPNYCYMENLMEKNKYLAKQLRDIHKSLPWKLIFPLRILDDFFRKKRQKNRARRRLKEL